MCVYGWARERDGQCLCMWVWVGGVSDWVMWMECVTECVQYSRYDLQLVCEHYIMYLYSLSHSTYSTYHPSIDIFNPTCPSFENWSANKRNLKSWVLLSAFTGDIQNMYLWEREVKGEEVRGRRIVVKTVKISIWGENYIHTWVWISIQILSIWTLKSSIESNK